MKISMKRSLLTVVLSSALLDAAPATVFAQAAATTKPAPSAASQLVLSSSTRILTTLEQRRAEFRKDPAALKQFITTEFNRMFDRDYAARLVLGVHGRGASEADVKLFSDALADNLMARYGTSPSSYTGLDG